MGSILLAAWFGFTFYWLVIRPVEVRYWARVRERTLAACLWWRDTVKIGVDFEGDVGTTAAVLVVRGGTWYSADLDITTLVCEVGTVEFRR